MSKPTRLKISKNLNASMSANQIRCGIKIPGPPLVVDKYFPDAIIQIILGYSIVLNKSVQGHRGFREIESKEDAIKLAKKSFTDVIIEDFQVGPGRNRWSVTVYYFQLLKNIQEADFSFEKNEFYDKEIMWSEKEPCDKYSLYQYGVLKIREMENVLTILKW